MKRILFFVLCLLMVGQVVFAETVTTQTSPATGVVKNIERTVATTNTANAIVRRDASGNFAAGTITATGVTGAVTGNVTGLAIQGGAAVAATSGEVVVPITNLFSSYTTNAAGAIAATLADGVAGQMKIIKLTTKDTNDMVITPANLSGGTTVTLDATGDTVILVFSGTEWHVVYTNGTIG